MVDTLEIMEEKEHKKRTVGVHSRYKKKKKSKAIYNRRKRLSNIVDFEKRKGLSLSSVNAIIRTRSVVKQLVFHELQLIQHQIKKEGIESFVPDAEAALLMCIKGFMTAKCHYKMDGTPYRTVEEFVPPNYQAAIAFLRYVNPEKWSGIEGVKEGDTYNIINAQTIDLDLKRLTRFAGSLLESNMTKPVESIELETKPINEQETERESSTTDSEELLLADTH